MHFFQDGSEKRCIAPFTLLGPHECQIISTEFETEEEEDDRLHHFKRYKKTDSNMANHKNRKDAHRKLKKSDKEKKSRKEYPTEDFPEHNGMIYF